MIKKSLLTFAFLFVIYNIFLFFNKVAWHSTQSQFQGSVIKSDRYIDDPNTPQAVVVGTSLSSMIVDDSIPGLYNLSMPGMALFDGCHILFKRKTIPPAVFIEVNYFYKDENKSFTSSFDSKIESFSKAHLLALRDENQPVGIIRHFFWLRGHPGGNVVHNTILPQQVLQELVKNHKKDYIHPDDKLISNGLLQLKATVSQIQARGSKVYFFEMPTDTSLEQLPLAVKVRQLITTTFADIPFLPIPKQVFSTIDGIHLNGNDAVEYTRYFKSYVQKAALN